MYRRTVLQCVAVSVGKQSRHMPNLQGFPQASDSLLPGARSAQYLVAVNQFSQHALINMYAHMHAMHNMPCHAHIYSGESIIDELDGYTSKADGSIDGYYIHPPPHAFLSPGPPPPPHAHMLVPSTWVHWRGRRPAPPAPTHMHARARRTHRAM